MSARSPPRPPSPGVSILVPTPPLPQKPALRGWSWVLKPPHQRVEEGGSLKGGRPGLKDATGKGVKWSREESVGGRFPGCRPRSLPAQSGSPILWRRGRLTSRVRISCWVRSLDTAHLVRSPRRLPMEISMSFWSCPHCCSARLAAAPAPPSAAAASPPPPPSFFSPIAAARLAVLSMPRHRGRGVAEAGSPGTRAPRKGILELGGLHEERPSAVQEPGREESRRPSSPLQPAQPRLQSESRGDPTAAAPGAFKWQQGPGQGSWACWDL